MRRAFTIALATLATALAVPATSVGREPPNQNDPCSSAGKNSCGTNGVGFYQRYRYGIRWFGDFRGAVLGAGPTFCIDLRWWYPSPKFRYALISSAGLRNSNGSAISAADQARMSYAIWNYGRSNDRNRQAATMLYVHSLMRDGAPGEVDPTINPTVNALFTKISEDANKYRGPYRVVADVPKDLSVGQPASVTVRVLSATGNAVPNVALRIAATGGVGAPTTARTNATGVATVDFTPIDVQAGFKAKIDAVQLAATLPRIYRAAVAAPRRNAQRMATSAPQRVSTQVAAPITPGGIRITTDANPKEILVGETNTDAVTVSGLPAGVTREVTVNVFGPFAAQEAIQCTGTPAKTSKITVTGSGKTSAEAFAPTAPGWYQYQLSVPSDPNLAGTTTSCGDTAERFKVRVQPRVVTKVNNAVINPGTALSDTVIASGLSGQTVTVTAYLYGPFGSMADIKCDVPPIWQGTVTFTADGEKPTAPVVLTVPGYYTYRESLPESDLVKPVDTTCGDAAETAAVVGTPTITTQVSSQETKPGSSISDNVVIKGLGGVKADVQVELWGPYNTVAEISCTGTPFKTQTFTATGDGTYTTEPVTIDQAGYYTYRESLAGSTANTPATTKCGEASETTLSRPGPAVTTLTSAEATIPGTTIFDNVSVTGLGRTPATVQLKLFGPFASRTAVRCSTPVWTGRISVPGDGTYQSPAVRIPKVGFYTFQEEILPSGLVPRVKGTCARATETVLGRPLILTGPGDPASDAITAPSTNPAPTRIRIAKLNVDAPVQPAGIDMRAGALAVPTNVRHTGWWRDGAAPGDAFGTTLIAGHIDSAVQGAGAFKQLSAAKVGMQVLVTTSDSRVRTYRVTGVQRVLKASLPAGIFTQRGAPRLVLVTCGGPFNSRIGHYRDNIIVTAVPA